MLELKKLQQTGQISEQEFKARAADLTQRTAEANQNYEMAKQTLEQRKSEADASTGLQGRALSETERVNKAPTSIRHGRSCSVDLSGVITFIFGKR